MDKSKCPDCEQPLADKSQTCPDCQNDKDSQKKLKTPGIFRAKPLLLIAIGIALLLLLAGGTFFFLRPSGQQNGDGQAPPAGDNIAAEPQEDDGASQTKDDEPDIEKPEPATLETILDKHYLSCKDMEPRGGRLTGFQELQTCVRERQEKIIVLSQFYQKPDPEAEVTLETAGRWCTKESGKKLSAIKGDQFFVLYASHIDLETIEERTNQSIFSPEYIEAGNKILEEEYKFLKSQGLEAELVNACTDF